VIQALKDQKKGMKRLHGNAEAYWKYQKRYAEEVLLPLFQSWGWKTEGKKVLEIGCSEGGILEALQNAGCIVEGVEISEKRAKNAKELQTTDFPVSVADICSEEGIKELSGDYDLIILRDVIEHLLEKDGAFRNIKKILNKNGRLFITFPPWFMPFGGHQQVLRNHFRFVPFLHLLPRNTYLNLIKSIEKDRPHLVRDLMDTYDARLTFRNFTKLLRRHAFILERKIFWMINPAYKIKFGLKERRMGKLAKIPLIREIFVTSVYAWIKHSE